MHATREHMSGACPCAHANVDVLRLDDQVLDAPIQTAPMCDLHAPMPQPRNTYLLWSAFFQLGDIDLAGTILGILRA